MEYSEPEVIRIGLIGLRSRKYGKCLWVKCRLRKFNQCEITKQILEPKDEAWRPMTNGYNRMHRISTEGMNRLITSKQNQQ